MRNFKKAIVKFLSAAVFVFFASGALIAAADAVQANNEQLKGAYFKSFSGVVKEIRDLQGIEAAAFLRKHVIVENQTGNNMRFVISKDTYFIDGDKIRVGADVTGFYRAAAPALMIFPPQYNAEIMVADQSERQIKADLFGSDLVSADGFLKLNVSPKTQVVWKDGSPFDSILGNRKLIVFYNVTTRSIPAQTTPSKIIVFEKPAVLTNDSLAQMDIIVNGEKISAPPAYLNGEKTVMVPLKPIAKALGFEVAFNDIDQSGVFADCILFKAGEDNYLYLKKIPLWLGTAPALADGEICVPLNFFTDIVRLNNAYVFENQIVIDNNEKMK